MTRAHPSSTTCRRLRMAEGRKNAPARRISARRTLRLSVLYTLEDTVVAVVVAGATGVEATAAVAKDSVADLFIAGVAVAVGAGSAAITITVPHLRVRMRTLAPVRTIECILDRSEMARGA
eukprot:Rmarinus@m.27898